jgi:hypothetical protein
MGFVGLQISEQELPLPQMVPAAQTFAGPAAREALGRQGNVADPACVQSPCVPASLGQSKFSAGGRQFPNAPAEPVNADETVCIGDY